MNEGEHTDQQPTSGTDSSTAEGSPTDVDRPVSDHQLERGATIGRYVILDRIGRGGMGEVYTAYDPELDRKVAIKLLHEQKTDAIDAADAQTRLVREAQALAKLSHPNVIAVYDAGTFAGRVFVAIEYVEGHTLRGWLKDGAHPWREVLDVFLRAGRGLAAAHDAGIVHRDFKPTNVMVGTDGRVRVLDFGLARRVTLADTNESGTAKPDDSDAAAFLDSLTSGSVPDVALTRTGWVSGTPSYMSPEQFRGEALDATTDQFSFCVALYRALFGRKPFAGKDYAELVTAVFGGRIQPPPRRKGIPGRIGRRLVRGLSNKPEGRYATMHELLDRLERDARPAWPRWLAFGGAMAAAVAVAATVDSVSDSPVDRCARVDERLVGVWDDARKVATSAAFASVDTPFAETAWSESERTLDGYAQAWLLARQDACEATWVHGEQSAEMLDLRMQCLDGRLQELGAVAELFAAADAHVVERAVETADRLGDLATCANTSVLRARVKPPEDPKVAAHVSALGSEIAQARAMLWAGKYADAVAASENLVAEARALDYGPLLADSLLQLGQALEQSGDAEAAENALFEAASAASASGHDTIQAKAWAVLTQVTGFRLAKPEQGHRFARCAAALMRRIGAEGELQAVLAVSWGSVYHGEANDERAIELYREALSIRERMHGTDHSGVAAIVNNLGAIHAGRGDFERALAYFSRALAISERRLGSDNPRSATMANNLAGVLRELGESERALDLFNRTLAVWERSLGPEHPEIATLLHNLGVLHARLGNHDDARHSYERALDIKRAVYGDDHPTVASTSNSVGQLLNREGRYQEALETIFAALHSWEQTLGSDHPKLAFALAGLGEAYLGLEQPDPAVDVLERAMDIRDRHPGTVSEFGYTRLLLARALWESGRDRPRAVGLARQALVDFEQAGRHYVQARDAARAWLAEHDPGH